MTKIGSLLGMKSSNEHPREECHILTFFFVGSLNLVERSLSNVTQTLHPGFVGLGITFAVAEVL